MRSSRSEFIRRIQREQRFVVSVISCLTLSLFSFKAAAIADNPYQAIVDRNVFALKPPPPPAKVDPEANKPPPPPITLTGITTILGSKRAFLTVNMPPKPPEQAKVQSFMLSEGQRDGDIEVLEIDEKLGMVKVNEFGTVTNLTWEKNGAKMAGGQPTPMPAAGGVPAPPANPFAPAGAAGFNKAIPSRTLRLPGAPGAQPQTGGGQTSTDPGMQPALASAVNTSSTPANQAIPERTPEESVLMYEANRLKNEQLIQSGARIPRMPQHPYLNGIDQSQPQTPNPQVPAPRPFSPFAPPQPLPQ